VATAIAEVSDRMTLLVREEIELAKAEVVTKVTKLAKGAFVGAVAGIFVLAAVLFALHGFAWLLYFELPIGNSFSYFWGFFILAAILLLLGAVAGFIAFRWVKKATPPTPTMAIDEAKKIRETVSSGAEGPA
jgi:H+/Cl- antiporter ClcA